MKSFRHAGDLGDIEYSLPVIRHLGGGGLYIEAANYTRQRLTPEKWAPLAPLLEAQPYIKSVREWKGEAVDYNLNNFRARMAQELREGRFEFARSLAHRMCATHGVPDSVVDSAWLEVSNPIKCGVIFSRSQRYHNPEFPWRNVWKKYWQDAVFIGLPNEYRDFCQNIGPVPYQPTDNLLDVARLIAGSELFVGNQSLCYAICEGLKKRAILEIWHGGPNCLFFREGVTHGWRSTMHLPNL